VSSVSRCASLLCRSHLLHTGQKQIHSSNPVFLCLRHCPLCKAAAEVRDDSSDKNWLIVGYAKKGSNTLVLVDTGEDGLEE
jgi:hypothetical protein